VARKSVIAVDGMAKPSGVWSNTIVAQPGRLVFIAGLVARNADGKMVGIGDMAAQTRQVCENLKRAIEAAGGALSDLVRVDVYVSDIAQFDAIHRVRREFFPTEPPVSTMVEVVRFVSPDALIEINAIAVLP
jgi:enamine deaminase RidA (YjgF/YER057c/UK114 family)